MTRQSENTVILIPAYQPGDALVRLTESLHHRGFSVVVVDDGSGAQYDTVFDGTSQYAHVLRCPVNRGKGSALKSGIGAIADDPRYAGQLCIVTADADGQHKPEDIEKVADAVSSHGGLVLGVRSFTGKVPLRSRFGNSLTKIVFAIASGRRIADTQTGLRGFEKAEVELYTSVPGEKYEYEMNVLFAAVYSRIPITEIPIETVYENNNEGSHFRPIRDSYRIYKAIFLARSMKKSIKSIKSITEKVQTL